MERTLESVIRLARSARARAWPATVRARALRVSDRQTRERGARLHAPLLLEELQRILVGLGLVGVLTLHGHLALAGILHGARTLQGVGSEVTNSSGAELLIGFCEQGFASVTVTAARFAERAGVACVGCARAGARVAARPGAR